MSETRRNQTGRAGSSRQNNADRILAVQNARNLGSGNQRRSSQGNRRRKRRRQGPDLAKLLLILIGVVIAVLCISVGLRACSKGNDKEVSQTEEVTTEPETEIQAEITVNGVSVHGMTKSEAEKKVLDAIGWDMKASYNGESKAIDNLMTSNVDEILTKAFEKGESASYTVSADGLEEAAAAAAASLADGWDVKPKNGSISSFDKSSGKFTFSAGEVGVEIDREKLASDIVAAANIRKRSRFPAKRFSRKLRKHRHGKTLNVSVRIQLRLPQTRTEMKISVLLRMPSTGSSSSPAENFLSISRPETAQQIRAIVRPAHIRTASLLRSRAAVCARFPPHFIMLSYLPA